MAATAKNGIAAAVVGLFSIAGSLAAAEDACPGHKEPYSAEPTPFGWPLTPQDWTWTNFECWNKTAGGYVTCGGVRQSPMDIDLSQGVTQGEGAAGLLMKASSYASLTGGTVRIDHYTRSAVLEGDLGTLTLKSESGEDVIFDAVQLHLTASSLHTVDGKHSDAEVMILHRPRQPVHGVDGVVVSALVRADDTAGTKSPLFAQLGFSDEVSPAPLVVAPQSKWGAPGTAGDGVVDLVGTMTAALQGSAWKYDGSVPVPPCSETLKWFVLETKLVAHTNQVNALQMMIADGAASWKRQNKRPPVPRKERVVTKDTLMIGGDHRGASCQAFSVGERARSAACWGLLDKRCREGAGQMSPVALSKAKAVQPEAPLELAELVAYRATEPASGLVTVKPSKYTLDVTPKVEGSDIFGHLTIHGRIFQVRKISVKAVAQHVIEGRRYEAELVVEHTMFGDPLKDTARFPEYQPREHVVMVSVPIKLGLQNKLLRQMGLGASAFEQTIRDGIAYSPIESVDLQSGLEETFAGSWFWYNGSKTQPDCHESAKWLVLETPIEASLEQLNYLSLLVPGFDSTMLPSELPSSEDPNVYLDHLPTHAVQVAKACPGPGIGWNYHNTHCWDKCTIGCSTTCTAGKHQSPINVETASAVQERGDNFLHICRWKPISGLHVANSGHSFVVANQQMGYIQQIGAGGFPEFYQVVQFHVHMPSEHMINGRTYHAEVHVVHAKQISVEELDFNKLLVVGILLEVGDVESGLLNQLLFPVSSKEEPPAPHEYEVSEYPIDLMRALGPVIDRPFYTYNGSLTTPPCTEGVKWFVFETPQSMSVDQWVYFKKTYANPANNRPTQPLNGRRLAKNSFDLPGVTKTLGDYDFKQLRSGVDGARDIRDPDPRWIIVVVFLTLVFCIGVMTVTFVRDDLRRREESAGGLMEMIGKPAYTRVSN